MQRRWSGRGLFRKRQSWHDQLLGQSVRAMRPRLATPLNCRHRRVVLGNDSAGMSSISVNQRERCAQGWPRHSTADRRRRYGRDCAERHLRQSRSDAKAGHATQRRHRQSFSETTALACPASRSISESDTPKAGHAIQPLSPSPIATAPRLNAYRSLSWRPCGSSRLRVLPLTFPLRRSGSAWARSRR